MKEHEIRPADLFQNYLDLAKQDIESFFADAPREHLPCPACEIIGEPAFVKLGFTYQECDICQSLWVSPRPTFESFTAFYSHSASSRYWANEFYPAVEAARRIKLWQPKAQQISEISLSLSLDFDNLIDIGGGSGTFAEVFREISDISVIVIEPSPESAAQCRSRGIAVINSFFENVEPSDLPQGHTIFTSFELFEHVHNPRSWLQNVADLMRPGDVFILTTLSSLGLDIRTLWHNSQSISPPHHINFLNPQSMSILAPKVGLQIVKIFTPGVLDLDIMKNNRAKIADQFWGSFLDSASDAELSRWQAFISEQDRSSHMWVVFRKP